MQNRAGQRTGNRQKIARFSQVASLPRLALAVPASLCPMARSEPSASQSSIELLRLLAAGDEGAAATVFERYAERLTRLARSRLAARLAQRIDAEDVVMSAYRSFFVAARQGRFELERGGDLWRLLVEVTLHKLY